MALTPDQEKLKEAALAYKRLLAAAKVYAFNYMQDEAADEEDCVCGQKQHAEAKEVFAAITEVESANPAAILAILAQLEQVQGWQPIETAPKDGTEIWAFNGEQARMLWSEGSSGSEHWALWVWADELLQDADPSPDQPTHYRPLPPPPEAA